MSRNLAAPTRTKTMAVLDLLTQTGISFSAEEISQRLKIGRRDVYDILSKQLRRKRIKRTYRIDDRG